MLKNNFRKLFCPICLSNRHADLYQIFTIEEYRNVIVIVWYVRFAPGRREALCQVQHADQFIYLVAKDSLPCFTATTKRLATLCLFAFLHHVRDRHGCSCNDDGKNKESEDESGDCHLFLFL